MCRRFGLAGYERETLEEVGEAIGLTRERVRQIQMSGLKAECRVFAFVSTFARVKYQT